MHFLRLLFCCSLLLLLVNRSQAQEITQDSSVRFFGVPLVFFSSDTKWGGGAGGVLTFPGYRLRSSVTFSLTYTQRKQWLALFPFVWYGRRGNWRVYGEAGWVNYTYRYFGLGNNYSNDYVEYYKAEYPRLRITATRSINRRLSAGLRTYLEGYRIIEKEPGKELDQHKVIGAEGGFSSGLGLVALLDTRRNQFFPRNGWYVENDTAAIAGVLAHGAYIGSSGAGRISWAARADYAEAAARVLLSSNQAGRIYELAGDEASIKAVKIDVKK